jgi:hypothetical protein
VTHHRGGLDGNDKETIMTDSVNKILTATIYVSGALGFVFLLSDYFLLALMFGAVFLPAVFTRVAVALVNREPKRVRR